MSGWVEDVGQWLGWPAWVDSEPAYLVLGALLAGITGLVTDEIKVRREQGTKRAYQLRMLKEELDLMDEESLPKFESGSPMAVIPTTMLPVILQSQALSYREDGEVLVSATRLYQSLCRFNGFVEALNQLEVGAGRHAAVLDRIKRQLTDSLDKVRNDRDALLEILGKHSADGQPSASFQPE
jgi:hypothetical protein